ncbi:hypothetical protein FXW78_28440 [Rhodococcus opacus]|nr:hypothetical protein [Rhodococcus opacus]RZL83165.1 MAG: hypothetical protein EOP32_08485 [Rhodococcus sp. (in: high G+C Gram-positive bacteria)]
MEQPRPASLFAIGEHPSSASAEPEAVETIDVDNRPASGPAPAATARDSSAPAAAAVAAAPAAVDVVDLDDSPWE